jgi:hypothetical protein
MLGSWNTAKGAIMQWHPGHKWIADVELEAGWHGALEFKVRGSRTQFKWINSAKESKSLHALTCSPRLKRLCQQPLLMMRLAGMPLQIALEDKRATTWEPGSNRLVVVGGLSCQLCFT